LALGGGVDALNPFVRCHAGGGHKATLAPDHTFDHGSGVELFGTLNAQALTQALNGLALAVEQHAGLCAVQ